MKSAGFAITLLSLALSLIARGNVDWATARDYLNRGNDQYELGNIEAAIASYSQAIKMAQNVPGFYCARGTARHALGDNKNALTDFDTAIQVSSQRSAPVFSGRAAIEISLGNYDAAIADLNRAITIELKKLGRAQR